MRPYTPSADRVKLGHITPSSNTVLEPMTALLSDACGGTVSHHFARIRVEAISLEERHRRQFDLEVMLAAAGLLADAGVDAIVWNGTSGAWNGLDSDRALCAAITAATGVPATTSMLAALAAADRLGAATCGVATPYTEDVAQTVAAACTAGGLPAVGLSWDGVRDNRAMAHVSEARVRELVREADAPGADCVLVVCTGLAAAHLAAELEDELGKPVIDTVAATLWQGLELVGSPPRGVGCGRLLDGNALGLSVRPEVQP